MTVSIRYYGSNGTVGQHKDAFVIFALNSDMLDASEERLVRFRLGEKAAFKQLKGAYKNVIETSYLVNVDLSGDLCQLVSDIYDLASDYDQESVLVVEKNREANLVFIDNSQPVYLGKFQESNPSEAIALGNWTLDGSTFWIVK